MTFELAEPVLVNRSVSFDGLLAHMNYRRTGDARTAHAALPLARIGDIWQASDLIFLGPVGRQSVHYVMSPRWDRFEQGMLVDRRSKPRAKIVARGAFKPTRDRYEAIAARRAFAIGLGDIDAILDTLDGLEAVGKKARSGGYGRLKRFRIDRLDEAPQGIGYADFTGRPVRPTPRDIWNRLKLPEEDVSFGPARPRLPRWATEDELCALPETPLVIRPHEQHRVGL